MRVGVDYRLAGRHLGGMAVYLKTLIGSLKRVDRANEYVLLDDDPSGEPGFVKSAWTIIWEHIWLQVYLPYFFITRKIDMAYFPNPPVSFFLTVPIVLTIPDVSFAYDVSMSKLPKLYLWTMYYLSAHRSKSITTFSQNSKYDIERLFHINPNKITVTLLAPAENIAPVRGLSKSKTKYIITVPGTLIARKNVEDTILAFKSLPEKLTRSRILMIVGYPHGEGYDRLTKYIAAQDMVKKVIFAGRVNDEELSKLYTQADLYVCSSLYEGFGLPILEAMTCGTPVISYNNSSLPEVVGDTGMLVNNRQELTQAMEKVLSSSSLRTKLSQLGLKHAAAFSWSRTTSAFLTALSKNAN